MSALGHYLEDEGLATTQISLVRLHTEKIKPPRALWVPFELGRPFGAPGNADFQRRVVTAVLELFERDRGPVLEDFTQDAPAAGTEDTAAGWVCPVALGAQPELDGDDTGLGRALLGEMHRLRPWYDMGCEARGGRTTVGVSGFELDDLAPFIIGFLGADWPENPRADLTRANTLKMAVEDLRNFYFEAATSRPGEKAGSGELQDWFWDETAAGRVFGALSEIAMASDDPEMRLLGDKTLIPRRQVMRARAATRKAS